MDCNCQDSVVRCALPAELGEIRRERAGPLSFVLNGEFR
jgi:hypothetical protein